MNGTDDDEDDETSYSPGPSSEPASKRRTPAPLESEATPAQISQLHALQTQPSSLIEPKPTAPSIDMTKKKGSGATSGKPDADVAFLKAVASTKKGRRHEDEFDREFNKLKITVPTARIEESDQDWDLLKDFGDENIRGNFMVVVDLEIHQKENTTPRASTNIRPEWQGKPNFKKFKQVCKSFYAYYRRLTNLI